MRLEVILNKVENTSGMQYETFVELTCVASSKTEVDCIPRLSGHILP